MNKQTVTTLIILIATTLIIGGAVVLQRSDKRENIGGTQKPLTSTSLTSSVDASSDVSYKDGTYTALGAYVSPEGPQKIGISLSLDNDVVTNTSAENKATGLQSSNHEEKFIANYKEAVVGKKIQDLNGLVSGDSLTLIGFKDAVAQIKTQAKKQ